MSLEKKKKSVKKVLAFLEKATVNMTPPMVFRISQEYNKNSFLILISCLLSLRSRDSVTYGVCKKLFDLAKTPQEILSIPIEKLQKIIKSVNFYKKKSYILHQVSADIINRFNGQVPRAEQELLSIKGVGRKTMNLVRSVAFDIPAICVDTHVHRIANQLGWVNTSTPEETERELKLIVPKNKWSKINYYLVMWGQNCPKCPLLSLSSETSESSESPDIKITKKY